MKLKIVAASLVFLLLFQAVIADDCRINRFVHRKQAAVVQKVVEKIVPVLAFTPVEVYYASYYPSRVTSTYSSTFEAAAVARAYPPKLALGYGGYQRQHSFAEMNHCEEKLRPLVEEIKFLRERQQQVEQYLSTVGQNSEQPQPLLNQQKPLGVFARNCASCHNDADNAAKGKGHVLFKNGEPDKWDADTRENILQQLITQKMPKGKTIKQEEFQEMVGLLIEMRQGKKVEPIIAPNGQNEKGNGGGK